MTAVTEMGSIIFPPLPGFYHRPQSIQEMIDHTVGRVLDLFAIEHALTPRWNGLKTPSHKNALPLGSVSVVQAHRLSRAR